MVAFSKIKSTKPVLLKYTNEITLVGRSAQTCDHIIHNDISEILDISLMEALYSEKFGAFEWDTFGNRVFSHDNNLVTLKYFFIIEGDINYLRVIITNNHDFPIYYQYTFEITTIRKNNIPN